MTFHDTRIGARSVAIIGGGISGLAAAYLLAPTHRVTLFEAAPRLGGHARTVLAGRNGDQPVDTGFIVLNHATYPHLTRMFADLDVPTENSDMSFGASIDGGRVEYALHGLGALFAQKRNMGRPGFYRMIRDILRFNARAVEASQDEGLTVGELMRDMRMGPWFQECYLTPLCGAIWSTPPERIRDFPARPLVQFMENHALLSARNQHQWMTVTGGSVEYVKRVEAHLRGRGVALRTDTPVQNVVRGEGEVFVAAEGAPAERFDEVIFACHSDQALALLDRPTPTEARALGAIGFQDNEVVLHRDASHMPARRPVWSSWVYRSDGVAEQRRIGVSYWMNRLQNIPESDPLSITLNPTTPIDESQVYDRNTFAHPVFDHAALRAQGTLAEIQGRHNTWFAGAWTRHGFHEDGFQSAVNIARRLEERAAAEEVAA